MNGWTLHYSRRPSSWSENADCICVQKYKKYLLVTMSIDAICTSVYPRERKKLKCIEKYKRGIASTHSIHTLNKAYSDCKKKKNPLVNHSKSNGVSFLKKNVESISSMLFQEKGNKAEEIFQLL